MIEKALERGLNLETTEELLNEVYKQKKSKWARIIPKP
jgi:hypothetical protein